MYNHHKRMLPKRDGLCLEYCNLTISQSVNSSVIRNWTIKVANSDTQRCADDAFRTEFPGNYYSSSSVYSYSPTSTSDCPEHGRSRRRTTLILVTSVVMATIAVLSIAGIAAYLGIISKNISNNPSQFEESYLQANTTNSAGASSEEDDIIYSHGRSKDESGFIDLTNSLSDTNTGIVTDNDDILINPQRDPNPNISSDVFGHKAIVTKTPEIVQGTKMNLTLKANPVNIAIAAKPVTVIVKSTSTISSTNSDPNNNMHGSVNNHYNPVEMISPPTRGLENFVTYFTEESTAVKSNTKPPPRNNRNRHRYPITNSHSLVPSTTTQISSGNPDSAEQSLLSNHKNAFPTPLTKVRDIVTSTSVIDDKYRSTIRTSGHSGGGMDRDGQAIVHVSPLDAKTNFKQVSDPGYTTSTKDAESQHHEMHMNQNTFANRLGLAEEDPPLHNNSPDNEENEDDPQTPNHSKNHNYQYNMNSASKGEDNSKNRPNSSTTPTGLYKEGGSSHRNSEHFVPVVPIVSSEREEEKSSDLLNNHKMHLTFDRISPHFYDKNPWTPLLNRPNMDKRPRVDINKPQGETTPQPIIVWNTEYSPEVNPSPESSPPQNYYGYGHSAPDSSGANPNGNHYDVQPTSEFDDNRAISHGLATDSTSSTNSNKRIHEQTTDSAVNKTKGVSEPDSSTEETTGGFRPVAIPSYTVIIPHIPNSPQENIKKSQSQINHDFAKRNGSKHSTDRGSLNANDREAEAVEDRNLNTSFKLDRVGVIYDDGVVSEEKREDDVNKSNKRRNDNDHFAEMAKNQAEDNKEEDYGDSDDLTVDSASPTKIYKLDPDNVDIVPDTLGGANRDTHHVESQDLRKHLPSQHDTNDERNSSSHEESPQEPDPFMKSTTDLIMSTLGSLNLIKPTPNQINQTVMESKLRASDVTSEASSEETEDETDTESPLFPPVRSYVSVNLPLRPKPEEEASGPSKQFRMTDEEGGVPILRPDLTTASSLQKVLSMMMKFEGDERSRHMSGDAPLFNITKQNVHLLLANVNGSLVLTTSAGNYDPVATPVPETNSSILSTTHREQKSYSNRDSKIDEQFTPPSNVEHIPVPLIVTESPKTSGSPSKLKLSSVTVNDKNSPVYKFVLRQGQSIEDLLKEIFQNYTDVQEEHAPAPPSPPTPVKMHSRPFSHSQFPSPSEKSLGESVESEQTTEHGGGVSFTNVKINHHAETTPTATTTPHLPVRVSTSDAPVLQTATSIVITEDDEIVENCPRNSSFRCVSNGKCIPLYLRCNFIKECPDNSDEANCSCADFLKANGNGRKLCDGVVDCADASDEYEYCEYCQVGQYICAGSRSCINRTQICDSKRDCPNGDDENECVKIGSIANSTEVEEFSSTYNKNGQLMVRKKGVWGKLCVETFSSVVSHWEVKDLARAVCKALTFSDFESVQRVQDNSVNSSDPYYELFYGVSNNETENVDISSSESTPRVGLGFKKTECKSKLVVNVTCQDLQCGTAPRSFTQTARIVGGANSMPGKWPWQAALYKNGEYQCGATLISSRWLLSAGHCFYNAQDDYWVARLGTLRRGATVLSPYEQVVKITHIFLHPQYQNVGFVNDVSLLRLATEVNFTDYVRPVCLPSRENRIRDGRMCTVVGWGQLFEVGRVFPDTLQEVQLPLISTAECRKRTLFLPLYKLTDQMFCAGFDRGGRDACLGDSGGPMMCQETDGRWSLYGVTSNGYGCARANRPGVYTNVASYLDWIYEKMNLDSSFVYRDKAKPCAGHRCLLGECLDRRQVCNGIVNCIEDNGSDERGPNCTLPGLIT